MIPLPEIWELQAPETIPIKAEEAREQARLVAALRCCWSKLPIPNRPVVFAVPNGGSRNKLEAANLRTQGALAGVPDLCIVLPSGKTVWIEMKASSGRPSTEQRNLHVHFNALGHKVLLAYSADHGLTLINWELNQ